MENKCKCTLNEFINCVGNCDFKTQQRKKILLESKVP